MYAHLRYLTKDLSNVSSNAEFGLFFLYGHNERTAFWLLVLSFHPEASLLLRVPWEQEYTQI